MPERVDDADEQFQAKAPPPLPREENIQPAKPPARPRDDNWEQEEDDRRRRRRREPDVRRDDDGVSTIIPYRNGMALAGYYLGVFSLIPVLGLILGPLGLIFGIVGLRRVNRNPEVKGTGHAVTAIVLGSISSLIHLGVLVIIILGILSSRR